MSTNYIELDEIRSRETFFSSARFMWKYCRAYKHSFIFALVLLALGSTCAIFAARTLGVLIEKGFEQNNLSESIKISIIVLVMETCSILCIWLGKRALSKAASFSILNLRKALFDHLQRLPVQYFDRNPEGRTVTRMTHDVEGIEDFFTGSASNFISAGFMLVIALIAMIATQPVLGLFTVVAMVPAFTFTYITRTQTLTINRKMSKMSSACNAKLSELYKGLFIIKCLGIEEWSQKQYEKTVDQYKESHLRANAYYSWTRPLISLLCDLPLILLFFFGGSMVINKKLSIGLFISYIRYCERFSHPIASIAREIHVVQQAISSLERIVSFLKAPHEEVLLGENGSKKIEPILGEIEFKNLTMGYDFRFPVLKNINLRLKPGSINGVIGRTGSGKTTFINLIARLYEFQEGSISIDHTNIRDLDRDWWRSQIGYVSQDPIFIKGTIRDNLITDKIISDEQILAAFDELGFQSLLSRDHFSLNSEILENGTNLSHGEKQLLALTRILLRKPKLLILDEATAHMDHETEQLVQSAILKVMKNKTCIIIAHRLETLEICDRVYAFQKGELIAQGEPDELFQISTQLLEINR